jgi:hypothetical protein
LHLPGFVAKGGAESGRHAMLQALAIAIARARDLYKLAHPQ